MAPRRAGLVAADAAASAAAPAAEAAAGSSGSSETVQVYEVLDHMREKAMWGGNAGRVPASDYGWLGATVQPTVDGGALAVAPLAGAHSSALLKAFDELIVNASDHALVAANRVRRIDIEFADGVFRICNDGRALPLDLHAEMSAKLKRPVYVPEVIFCVPLSGTNMQKRGDNVKGGINGIGAKFANIYAEVFVVEACDGRHAYRLECRDRLRTVLPATLEPAGGAAGKPATWTAVTMTPAYAVCGYTAPPAPAELAEIAAWIRFRACEVQAFLGPTTTVCFNAAPCPTPGIGDLAAVYAAGLPRRRNAPGPPPAPLVFEARSADAPRWPLRIAAVVDSGFAKFQQFSVVNGVHTRGGTHVAYLRKLFVDAAAEVVRKRTKDKDREDRAAALSNSLALVVLGAIPGIDWGGQRKDELSCPLAQIAAYTVRPGQLAAVAGALAEALLAATAPKAARLVSNKYTRAQAAGAAATLFVAEGDSAITFVRQGLALGLPGAPAIASSGILSLGGVILNALKESNAVRLATGEIRVVPATKLVENKVLQTLMAALKLEFGASYRSAEARRRLGYGRLVACVDQDLDGCGKILGLLLTFFHTFWPELIEAGYLAKLVTPLIRGHRRGDVVEFDYQNEFDTWADAHGGVAGLERAGWQFFYFKGLASHDGDQVAEIFESFERRVVRFGIADAAAARAQFGIYFGDDAEARKTILRAPAPLLSQAAADEIRARQLVDVTVQLGYDSNLYKRDALKRQLPSVADGLTVASRKVAAQLLVHGARGRVFQHGGRVAANMAYHHGEASLNATIIGMAQRFLGAWLFPFLRGHGQLGSRYMGGADAGQPRYVDVSLATAFVAAAFPRADTPVLAVVYEDGAPAEPVVFAPVLPLALCNEFRRNPSEGWAVDLFPRDHRAVAAIVDAFAAGDSTVAADVAALADFVAGRARTPPDFRQLAGRVRFRLPPATQGFAGEFRDSAGHVLAGAGAASAAARTAAAAADLPAARRPRGRRGLSAATPSGLGRAVSVNDSVDETDGAHDAADAADDTGDAADAAAAAYARRSYAPLPPRTLADCPLIGPEYVCGAHTIVGSDADGATILVSELPHSLSVVDFLARFGYGPRADAEPTGADAARAALVESIDDRSARDQVDIRLRLRPGALAQIGAGPRDAVASPVERWLGLVVRLTPQLNFVRPGLGAENGVLEFGNDYYAAVIAALALRRDVYKLRLERDQIAAAARLLELLEIERFICESGGEGRDEFVRAQAALYRRLRRFCALEPALAAAVDASAPAPRASELRALLNLVQYSSAEPAVAAFRKCGFQPLETRTIHAAAATAAEIAAALRPAAVASTQFEYLLGLAERERVESARARRLAQIRSHASVLAAVTELLETEQPFPGANIWRAELRHLLATIDCGLANNWWAEKSVRRTAAPA